MAVPAHLQYHPLFAGARFGILSADAPKFTPTLEGHEHLLRVLKDMGLDHVQTHGRYDGKPERSVIVKNPSREQMQSLGRTFGQESVVYSEGRDHKLLFVNGPDSGKTVGTKLDGDPIDFFSEPPKDNYTHLPGHGYFRINFDFGQSPESGAVQPMVKGLRKDLMPGGKGDDRPDSDFDAEQLSAGAKSEMEEHGLDEARAKEVAKDHLTEDPHYYSKMKKADAWTDAQGNTRWSGPARTGGTIAPPKLTTYGEYATSRNVGSHISTQTPGAITVDTTMPSPGRIQEPTVNWRQRSPIMKRAKSGLTKSEQVSGVNMHPHAYPWHDWNTSGDDLTKADPKFAPSQQDTPESIAAWKAHQKEQEKYSPDERVWQDYMRERGTETVHGPENPAAHLAAGFEYEGEQGRGQGTTAARIGNRDQRDHYGFQPGSPHDFMGIRDPNARRPDSFNNNTIGDRWEEGNYWHDVAQRSPLLRRSRNKLVHKSEPSNPEFAPPGTSDAYRRLAAPYGNIATQNQAVPSAKIYPLEGKHREVEKLMHDHGYAHYYAGGKYGKPDLAKKNYETGHLMIYAPEPEVGGTFGERGYTDTWRKSHELAHALTLKELNGIYGEGQRMGKLGVHRTLNEALRAVHWEWLAVHKQRDLLAKAGVNISDQDFHKELNNVMHDAVHRAVTGKFTDPEMERFVPHAHKVPLSIALDQIRDEARKLGLQKARPGEELGWGITNLAPLAAQPKDQTSRAVLSDYAADHGLKVRYHTPSKPAAKLEPHADIPLMDFERGRIAQSGHVAGKIPPAERHPSDDVADCINAGFHMADVDEDGYCLECGRQENDGVDSFGYREETNQPKKVGNYTVQGDFSTGDEYMNAAAGDSTYDGPHQPFDETGLGANKGWARENRASDLHHERNFWSRVARDATAAARSPIMKHKKVKKANADDAMGWGITNLAPLATRADDPAPKVMRSPIMKRSKKSRT